MQFALLTAVCFALTAVCARQSASLIGPPRANFLRLVIAFMILGIISLAGWRVFPWLQMEKFALAGGIGFGLGGFCMMHALKRLGSPVALLTVESLTAIVSGFLAWICLKDPVTSHQALACMVILGGVFIAGSGWIVEGAGPAERASGGYTFAVLAAVCQAVSLVISRWAFLEAARTDYFVSKFHAAFIRLSGGAAIALVIVVISLLFLAKRTSAGQSPLKGIFLRGESLGRQPLVWVTANALFGPVLGVTFWLWAVSMMNPGLVQSIAATAPLISIPLSRRLELTRFRMRFYLGAAISVTGLALLFLW